MGDISDDINLAPLSVVDGTYIKAASRSVYQSLYKSDSIRLLVLEPGSLEDPLVGTLQITNIKDSNGGHYEPLSYVWGTDSGAYQILIRTSHCEQAVDITSNLYKGLQRLRLPDHQRSIWADQICINQKDLQEKNHQLRFMNQLYRSAERVLVWLGPDTEGQAKSFFKLISELEEAFQLDAGRRGSYSELDEKLDLPLKESLAGLYHLTELKWFTRGWIVQEIGTGAPATLLWGEAEIEWATLSNVCHDLQNYYHLRRSVGIRTDAIRYLYHRFKEPESHQYNANRYNFVYELHRARGLHFSDQRDRVYAWLGHFSFRGLNTQLSSLQADYSKPLTDVYVDLARRALLGEKDNSDGTALITLAAVQHISQPSSSKASQFGDGSYVQLGFGLPTWVPDWRVFQSFILSEPISPFRAHGTSTSKLELLERSSLLLRIHGLEIDSIEASSTIFPGGIFTSQAKNETINTLWHQVCCHDHFELSTQYINDESAFFAFMQTLAYGCAQIAMREKVPYNEVSPSTWLEHAALYLTGAMPDSAMIDLDVRKIAQKAMETIIVEQWSRCAGGATENRVFARTRKGYYVLGPKTTEPGDIVCVLYGGKLPFILRPWGESHYLLVGECYVHGLMHGEAMGMSKADEAVEKVFDII